MPSDGLLKRPAEKIGCIGVGAMGSSLMKAVAKTTGAENVFVSDACFEKTAAFAKETGCTALPSNAETASAASFLFLAVKPQFLSSVLNEINGSVGASTVIVSMAAGVKIEHIRKQLDGQPLIVRIMPNMPVACGCGMIAIAPDAPVPAEKTEALRLLLAEAGQTEITPEPLMDAVTAVSGSGPAFGFIFIEAMADAAVQLGMPRAQAVKYAAQTLKGTAAMVLETGEHPAVLKDSVCSPAGTTITGVAALEAGGFRSAVINAVVSAGLKSSEMGRQ